MSKSAELRGRIANLAKEHLAALEQYPDYDFPPEVEEAAKARNLELTDLGNELKRMQDNEKLFGDAKGLNEHFNSAVKRPAFPTGDGSDPAKSGLIVPQSIGQRFTESEEWKTFAAQIMPNGFVNEKVKVTSPQVQMGSLFRSMAERKAVVTGGSATSGGALVFPDVRSAVELPFRPLVIRDVVTVGETMSDTVEYPRVTAMAHAATTVAESTVTTPGGAGIKPEAAITLEKVTAAVKTIAVWIPASKRALADAAQLRTLIDGFLLNDLEEELEDQMVQGNNVGEDFIGIANIVGTQSQAFDTDLLTTIRKARTLVRVVGKAVPRAILLHPNDKEDLDLLQDNEGRYYFGGPATMNNGPVWSMPVVESEAVPEGTAYVGDFKQCVLWVREQGGIQVSDNVEDYFVRNLVAILAEMRAAFGCLRPAAIVEVALS